MSEESDQLTGLKTRRSLFSELDRRLKSVEPVAILLLNIDKFKAVNDTFGVEVGNNVLRAIAAAVSRRADSYRFGGSAFAAVASVRSRDQALQLAESIRADINALSFDEHRGLKLTVRVGVAISPDDAMSTEELHRCADDALFKATRDGGDCVRMYDLQARIDRVENEIRVLGQEAQGREQEAYLSQLELLVATRTRQLKNAFTELEKSYDTTLDVLGQALGLRDAETESHSLRVTAFSVAVARAMNVAGEQINAIARGAFLHDFGKLAVPDAILRKPGALTPEETVIMRQYVRWGYDVIKTVPFLGDAAEIIHCHQERHDRTGYPRGLSGDQIPLGAKIVAVANAFDAMTSDRPYRSAQGSEVARREIEAGSGRQFDPLIVRVFLEMSEVVWDQLRSEVRKRPIRPF